MVEREGIVTINGSPLTLIGDELKVGDRAPNARVVDAEMGELDLASLFGKLTILASVPSLDTPVCALETRNFNVKASELGPDVQILVISMDLPFAQKRWCAAEGVNAVRIYSDYRYADFGERYGVLLKELRLLARAVFIIDSDKVVRYVKIVPEITHEPDYESVLSRAREILNEK